MVVRQTERAPGLLIHVCSLLRAECKQNVNAVRPHRARSSSGGRRDKDMKRTQTSREAQLEGDGSAGRLICRFSPESGANNSCRCLVSILCSHKKTVCVLWRVIKICLDRLKRCCGEDAASGRLEGKKTKKLGNYEVFYSLDEREETCL